MIAIVYKLVLAYLLCAGTYVTIKTLIELREEED